MAYAHNGILFSHEKGNSAICNGMNLQPGGHYAKGNKSDRERHTLYGISSMQNFFKGQTHKNRIEWWLPGGGGNEILLRGCRVLVMRLIDSGLDSMVAIVSNSVLYT